MRLLLLLLLGVDFICYTALTVDAAHDAASKQSPLPSLHERPS